MSRYADDIAIFQVIMINQQILQTYLIKIKSYLRKWNIESYYFIKKPFMFCA